MLEFDQDTGQRQLTIQVFDERSGGTARVQYVSFPVRIGRNPLNDLVLDDPYVSQWHAAIGFVGGELAVLQVGTSNPIFIGDHRLSADEMAKLPGNDVIQIVPFRLILEQVADATEQPASLEGRVRRKAEITQEVDEVELPDLSQLAPPVGSDPVAPPLAPTLAVPVPDLAALTVPVPDLAALTVPGSDLAALTVLRRLAWRFGGAELAPDSTAIADFGRRLERALEVLAAELDQLLVSGREVRGTLAPGGSGAAGAVGVEQWLAGLLAGDHLAAHAALKQACRELLQQQLALLETLRAGGRALLERLSPRLVSAKAAQLYRLVTAKSLWQTYETTHRDLAEDGGESMLISQFGALYAKLTARTNDER